MTSEPIRTFYRAKLAPVQARRAECLILVATLWPSLGADSTLTVAKWVYRGDAKIREVSRG